MKKNYGIAFAVCLVIVYVAVRSYTVDFTHDEAYSFHNVKHFWYAEFLCTANSHWLNSLAMKLAVLCRLENNWQLRWFSTISALVFFSIGFLWIRSLENIYHKILACSLLLCNPYVLDYFGLARGYASGLMFEGLGMLLFIINLKKHNRLIAFSALLCAGLSAIANYSFVYFFAAFACVYFYTHYFKHKQAFLKNKNFYIDFLMCFAITVLIIRAWIFIIRCSGDMWGAGTNSITNVGLSFIDGLLYRNINPGNLVLVTLSSILFSIVVAACLYGVFRFKQHGNEVFFYCSLVLSIILFILFINFICFKIPLPSGRSALFMFPLLCVCVAYFMAAAFKVPVKNIVLMIFSILLVANFLRAVNFNHTLDYCAQEETKKVYDYVESIGAKNIAIAGKIYGVYRNYYQMTNKLKYSYTGQRMDWVTDLSAYDYILLPPHCVLPLYNHNQIKLDTIKRFPVNNIVLLKVDKL